MRAHIPLMLATILFFDVNGANAQPSSDGFWLTGDVKQGMAEGDFYALAKKNEVEITTPMPDKSTKIATIDGTNYWLSFCDGGLTYASWTLADNKTFHRSMDKWLNDQGFVLSDMRVSSEFNDRSTETLTILTIVLAKSGSPFSVTFIQFAENSQIVLEDVRYDQSYGCTLDRSK